MTRCPASPIAHEWESEKLSHPTPATPEGLREALARQTENMAFILNRVELPPAWLEKFDRELDEDRAALSTPSTSSTAEQPGEGDAPVAFMTRLKGSDGPWSYLPAKDWTLEAIREASPQHQTEPLYGRPAVGEELLTQIDAIRRQVKRWIEYDKAGRDREGLETLPSTHITSPPTWPSHGQLAAWVDVFDRAIAALQPQAEGE